MTRDKEKKEIQWVSVIFVFFFFPYFFPFLHFFLVREKCRQRIARRTDAKKAANPYNCCRRLRRSSSSRSNNGCGISIGRLL